MAEDLRHSQDIRHAAIWPIGSTGAAAKQLFENADSPIPKAEHFSHPA
jgi:hypothetical protein